MENQRLPIWGVRARDALAVALQRRDAPGDRDRAASELAVAADEAAA
jgi:hypothetical protein